MRAPEPLPEVLFGAAVGDCLARGRPCVVRGAARAWPALTRWSFEHLGARLGARAVATARLDRERRLGVDRRRGVDLAERAAADVLARIADGDASAYLMEALPDELERDVVVPEICRGPWTSAKLWVSPAGAVSPLHFDLAHNFHALVSGEKRFLVFERGHFGAMYPEPPWSSVPNFSRVDPERFDAERFPRFAQAKPWSATLEPGDAVMLPSRTWHHVTSNRASISVNFWWARGALGLIARGADALKRARGISR